jgi:hypothetical protein
MGNGKLHFISEIYENFPLLRKKLGKSRRKSEKVVIVGKVGKSRKSRFGTIPKA